MVHSKIEKLQKIPQHINIENISLPTICLSMIVKNESKIICRLLDSIKSIIDFACICDTGSTDNTIEVINDYFKMNNMKGKIITKDFINFQENRNYALIEAKKCGDYILLLDSDMKLINANKLDKSKLDGKGYNFLQKNGTLSYYNLRLVPSNISSKYIGVTHEYLDFNGVKENLDILYIEDIGDGGCKNNKYTRDEELLKKGLDFDPNNKRYMFYLANTLNCLKKYEEAIKYYKHRIDAGGYDQEIFYSKYKIGCCYECLNQIDQMEKSYMDAWIYRPTRAEPLYDLTKYFRINGNYTKSWAYAKIGKNIEIPKDVLFVHTDKYGINFDREISIVSFYVTIAKKTHKLFKKLFQENTCMLDLSNYTFYRKHFLPDTIKDYSCTHTLDYNGTNIKYYSSTPCIIPNKQGGYDFLIRMVNYLYDSEGKILILNSLVSSIYKKLILDRDFNFKETDEKYYTMAMEGIIERNQYFYKQHGIEDMRLFYKNNSLKIIGNAVNKDNKICIVTGELEPTFSYNYLDMINNYCEKNCCVIPTDNVDKLILVYKWSPLTIIETDIISGKVEIIKKTKLPAIFDFVRGSTNGYLYKNNIYFLGHIVEHLCQRRYSHIVIKFTDKMDYLGCSYPFKFSNLSIEYCLGMIVEDERIIFSYSENDRTSKIAIINKDRFFKEHWMN